MMPVCRCDADKASQAGAGITYIAVFFAFPPRTSVPVYLAALQQTFWLLCAIEHLLPKHHTSIVLHHATLRMHE